MIPPSQKLQATGGLSSARLQHRNFWPMCSWVVRGGEETHPVHLYNFKWTRSGKNVLEFLDGFEGCVLQSDGYSGYDSAVDFWNENHPGQKLAHSNCNVHARRYFADAVKATGSKTAREAVKIRRDFYGRK